MGADKANRRTLRGEFLRVTIPLIFLSVISVFAVIEFMTHRNAMARMDRTLQDMVRSQAAALANPLWNLDDDQVRLSLEAAVTNQEVLSARVLGDGGEVFAEAGTVPADAAPGNLMTLQRDIAFDAGAGPKRIGALELVATRSLVWEQTRNRLVIAAFIALVAVTIEVGAALYALRTIIGRPLAALLAGIDRAKSGNDRRPVQWHSTNELGQVIQSFNEMQAKQEAYEDELRRARDTLENRVAERTAELAAARDDSVKARTRLDDAIEAITEGFSLYDADDRLVVSNSRYRELLHTGGGGRAEPGEDFESVLRAALDDGLIAETEDPEAWLAARMARHRNPGPAHIQRYSNGRWISVSERRTHDGGVVAVYSDITELKQREEDLARKTRQLEQLSSQLAKYLSPQVYQSIFQGRQEVKIAASRKKLTVFFSDIADFTETAERMESEELTQLLNHYLTEMSDIATAHGATIDKYVGDAIVIFFGDPETRGVRDDALACVRMAIAMRERMKSLETTWRHAGIARPLRCRMGIHTDYCTVGNFGSEDRLDYTIIGRGVNIAARLEAQAPAGEILISYETYAHVTDDILCEERDEVEVKGVAYPVANYQVIGPRDEIIDGTDVSALTDADPDALSEADRQAMIQRLTTALERLTAASGDSGSET